MKLLLDPTTSDGGGAETGLSSTEDIYSRPMYSGKTKEEVDLLRKGSTYSVPITKGKGTLEVCLDDLPDAVYKEVILQGLKTLANRGMTKITKETYPKADELKTAAMAKAQETIQAMLAGKVRITGGKASGKASGKVMTEARRIAKNMVKDEMKAQGIKISYVDAKDITALANQLIANDPSIVAQAEESLKAQEDKAKKTIASIDVKSVAINPKKKAAAEAKKAEAKTQLSALQAGKTKVRSKPATV